MTLAKVRAVARFELRRRTRSVAARGTAAALLVLTIAGRVGGGPDVAAELYGYGWLLALLFGVSFGLAEDRSRAFDELVVGNLLQPGTWVAGKVAALYAALLGFGLAALLVGVAALGGGLARAAWPGVAFLLVAWTAAPAALLVEAALGVRAPMVVVAAAVLVGVGAADALGGDPGRAVALLGLDLESGDWSSLAPLARRAAVAVWPVLGLGAWVAARRAAPAAARAPRHAISGPSD